MKANTTHYIYLVLCADGTYYCGYTTDLIRRIAEHNGLEGQGARYTRSRRPVKLQYFEEFPTRGEALKREHQIKQLPRAEKRKLASIY